LLSASIVPPSGILADLAAFGCIYAEEADANALQLDSVTVDDARRSS
jgi:hypothetical protein